MSIEAKDFEFIVQAYKILKRHPERNAYWEKRNNDEKYMDRLLTRGDLYYGENNYQFWDSGVMQINLSQHALQALVEKYSSKDTN